MHIKLAMIICSHHFEYSMEMPYLPIRGQTIYLRCDKNGNGVDVVVKSIDAYFEPNAASDSPVTCVTCELDDYDENTDDPITTVDFLMERGWLTPYADERKYQNPLKPRRPRGRPVIESARHATIVDAWSTGNYKTYRKLSQAINICVEEIARVINRESKRKNKLKKEAQP